MKTVISFFLSVWGLLVPQIAVAEDNKACGSVFAFTSYIHVAKIDLHCPTLKLVVSQPSDSGLTVSEFAKKYQLNVALNGSFFRTDMTPIGLTISGGVQWDKTRDFRNKVFFACDKNNRCMIENKGVLTPKNPRWQIAISGWQSFDAKSGKFECANSDLVGCKPNIFETRHPRSMLGLDETKRWLYLVVVEGRQLGFSGVTLDELANIAKQLKLSQALNLDGGGSSTLVVDQKRISALPLFQGRERAVANHLGAKW